MCCEFENLQTTIKWKQYFFKNGVYVCSEEEFNFEDNDNKVKADASIILSNNKNPNSRLLYGGRVKVSLLNAIFHIAIDGIEVNAFGYRSSYNNQADIYQTDNLSVQKATAYLNQIEQLGIDTFLENYKTALETFKADIMVLCEKYESLLKEEEPNSGSANTYKDFLDRARACLTILTIILFSLACNMKTGLDNHVYDDAYNEVLAEYDVVSD